jgi:hypothetical protein
LNQDKARLLQDRDTVLWVFQLLGLVINWKKSSLVPQQIIEFLGFQVDSRRMTLTLPEDKIQDIQARCHNLLKRETTTVRHLAKLIGKLTASAQAVLSAPLYYRRLQMQKSRALLQGHQSYESMVTLTPECKKELRWWIEELEQCNGKTILKPQPDLIITTDASKTGWGGEMNGIRTQGQWSMEEATLHINLLEMKAAEFVVKAFTKDKKDIHCHLRMDNSSCVAQVNKMGGTRSAPLFEAVSSLWNYCLQKGITLTAEHLAGSQNLIADEMSRVFTDSSNWKLQEGVFQTIQQRWGPLGIDLFPDRLNAQMERYASWKPDPMAIQVDSFLMNWKDQQAYAFPPFCLVNRCLAKIKWEQATVVIITPVWHTQIWYPHLLEMSISLPLLLPPIPDLLKGPRGQMHPMIEQGHLHLAAWRVSGDTQEQFQFQKQLQPSSEMHGERGLKKLTVAPGISGVAGVVRDKLIHFEPLWNF